MSAPPRIFKVEYKSAVNGRVAKFFIKVPYGVYADSIWAMTDELTALMRDGQIARYAVAIARPGEVTPEVRSQLARWRVALARTTARTRVEWT